MSAQEVAEIFLALDDVSPLRRSKAIEDMRASVKENNAHLLIGNVKRIFSALKVRLRDSNWNVAHQSIQFLSDLFRNQDLGPDCKTYLALILPTLVENLGDTKIVIRKASQQLLNEMLQHTDSVALVIETILFTGFENDDWRVRQESVQALNVMVNGNNIHSVDFQSIFEALVSRLRDASMVVVQAAQETLSSLRSLSDEDQLLSSIKKMASSQQQLFAAHSESIMEYDGTLEITPAENTLLQFGFVPINVVNQLRDATSWKVRAAGIEQLQRLAASIRGGAAMVQHLPSFMEFCVALLADSNFKIALTTVQILGVIVEKFEGDMQSSLRGIVPPLIDKLGDNKIVVRQAIMKVFKTLMLHVDPEPIVDTLLANFDSKNARIREEVVNILIVTLITAIDHDFDFPRVVASLCGLLCDKKPKVTDAASDALAVICARIGLETMNGFLTPALVDEDMFHILQERFSRRELPKLSAEGIVLHVTQGGGRGLTIDSDYAEDGRRQTPASPKPSTTPTNKIPWDLPNSRSGPRLPSGAGGRRTAGTAGSARSVTICTPAGDGQQPGDEWDGEWNASGNGSASPPGGQVASSARPISNGVQTASRRYFENSDYKPLPAPPDDGSKAWWENGDEQPYGDLAEPISPARSHANSPERTDSRARHSPSPGHSYHSPAASSPYGHQSPQSPMNFGAALDRSVARPTPAVLFTPEGGTRGGPPASPRSARQGDEPGHDKVKLWLPGGPEGAQASRPYGDAADYNSPLNTPHRSGRRAGLNQPPGGSVVHTPVSAPVSAPSSAASSMQEDGYAHKLKLLKTPTRGPAQGRRGGPQHSPEGAVGSPRCACVHLAALPPLLLLLVDLVLLLLLLLPALVHAFAACVL